MWAAMPAKPGVDLISLQAGTSSGSTGLPRQLSGTWTVLSAGGIQTRRTSPANPNTCCSTWRWAGTGPELLMVTLPSRATSMSITYAYGRDEEQVLSSFLAD